MFVPVERRGLSLGRGAMTAGREGRPGRSGSVSEERVEEGVEEGFEGSGKLAVGGGEMGEAREGRGVVSEEVEVGESVVVAILRRTLSLVLLDMVGWLVVGGCRSLRSRILVEVKGSELGSSEKLKSDRPLRKSAG